jgi:hypothetical protein
MASDFSCVCPPWKSQAEFESDSILWTKNSAALIILRLEKLIKIKQQLEEMVKRGVAFEDVPEFRKRLCDIDKIICASPF